MSLNVNPMEINNREKKGITHKNYFDSIMMTSHTLHAPPNATKP